MFGEPPGPLLPLHRRRCVNEFWERMVDAMLHPVTEDPRFGIRRVQVLGQRIFEFAPDGRIDVQDWADPDARSGRSTEHDAARMEECSSPAPPVPLQPVEHAPYPVINLGALVPLPRADHRLEVVVAQRVVAGLRGTHAGLEALFDRAAEARP